MTRCLMRDYSIIFPLDAAARPAPLTRAPYIHILERLPVTVVGTSARLPSILPR